VVQGLQIDDSELREFTHGMLGSIAEKLGKDFAPFLPHAVEAAFASCSQVRALLHVSSFATCMVACAAISSCSGLGGLLNNSYLSNNLTLAEGKSCCQTARISTHALLIESTSNVAQVPEHRLLSEVLQVDWLNISSCL